MFKAVLNSWAIPRKKSSFKQCNSWMVWIFIPQNDQHISGFNFEYLPGLLGEDNLTAVAHTNRSEYMLAFGRYAFAGLLLVVMDEVVQFHVVQFCQRVTVQNVGTD